MLGRGTIIDARYEVLCHAGSGGMGDVYEARRIDDQKPVALKLIADLAAFDARFLREARLLASLDHPGIVRHLGHGPWEGGRYIAMEWAAGRTLEDRLAGAPLSVGETIALGRRLSETLRYAHGRGVVHRDVKPSNVMLRDGDAADPVLLDFGVARGEAGGPTLTRTGAILGTAGYMAPEQAMGAATVDGRADVFSLGCVLYECIAGVAPFEGPTPVATLAKLLLGEAPTLRDVVPTVPEGLALLVARMLTKEPDRRPDTVAVLAELDAFEHEVGPASLARARSSGLLRGEQRIHSVLFVEISREDPDATVAREDLARVFAPLERAAARYGGKVVPLGSVAAALALEARTSAADRARQAVATATEIVAAEPGARVAIATGRAETLSGRPAGPVIERASRMLVTSAAGTILLDEATRGLLGGHHDRLAEGEFYALSLIPAPADEEPLLLGKRTPFVGRARELAVVASAMEEAFDEARARVTLISAPPGLGKSRLVREVVARHREAGPHRIIGARCEIVARASPLSLARAIVRAAAGLTDTDPVRSAERLRSHLATLGAELAAHADFLLEMAGFPAPSPSPELVAARNEPLAMREGLRAAFESFLDRSSAAGPLLLTLEDIHWADSPSLALIASALRRSSDRPLFVLATARPELDEEHPTFVRDCQAEVLRVGAMARRHREELVRAVLGDKATDEVVLRIAALSDGNAFYLEELIRCASEGAATALPESVVAMAQVRLSALDEEARGVLRAASVYRAAVGAEGVAAVLGTTDVSVVESRLATLANEEVLARRDGPGGDGHVYVFRHALLEAAAYGMLPAHDRHAGHVRAAEWLETSPASDPAVIADHYQRGGDDPRALPFIARAARAFVEADHLESALGLTARGLSLGATGDTRGVLLAVRGLVLGLKGDWETAARDAAEGMSLLPQGSPMWFRSAGTVLFADAASGRNEGAIGVLGAILSLDRPPEPTGPFGRATTVLITGLLLLGQGDLANQLLARMTGAQKEDQDPSFSVWMQTASSHVALLTRGEVGPALMHARRAVELARGPVDPIARVMANLALARTSTEVGRTDEALEALDRAGALADKLGTSYLRDWVRVLRGGTLGMSGRYDEGALEVGPNVDHDNLAVRGLSLMTTTRAAVEAGRLDEAESILERANRGGTLPLIETISHFHHARVALARGRFDEALRRIELHRATHARAGHLFGDVVAANNLRARVLDATGRLADARTAMEETLSKIHSVASAIPDASDVEAFMASTPCAEAFALAARLGVPTDPLDRATTP